MWRLLSSGLALALVFAAQTAAAQSTIRNPGQHRPYDFEAEPHLLVGPFDPPGYGRGAGYGLGFRGTIEILPRGFIKTINNSVGIGFGLDWVHYPGGGTWRGYCTHRVPGTWVCDEVDHGAGRSLNYIYLPVVMQWNFWLTRQFSVFGEPGLVPHFRGGELGVIPITLYAGGRFHFSDQVALTFRIGYPTVSLGASFFL